MSSQDTLKYAESEEQSAKNLQSQIDSLLAKNAALQKDMGGDNDAALQKDIDSNNDLIAGYQQKVQQHTNDAQRLRQQAVEEQKQEQEELLHEQEKGKDSLAKNAAQEIVRNSFF